MQKVRLSRWSLLLGVSLGVLGTLGVQHMGREAQAGKDKAAPLERRDFHDTLDVVLDRYVEPVDTPTVMSRGLKHMVAGLDPYSNYMTAKERELAKTRARQGGSAGLVTTLRNAGSTAAAELEVIAVHPGSPAAQLGIAPGTKLLSIRGRSAASLLSNAEAQLLLSGAKGERIELSMERGAGPESLELELDRADSAQLVDAELIEHAGHQVAYIAIHAFRQGTGEKVKQSLASLYSRAGGSLAGVVLDVRGNPGGEVDEALVVADLFVREGVLTRTRGRGGVILREELATSAGTYEELPVIVLQDARSASASELLAVALQDNRRAKVMGERSFGKGTVQELIGLSDGSLLTLTVARYFSPNDRNIDKQGVEPDIPLERASASSARDAACRELVSLVAQR